MRAVVLHEYGGPEKLKFEDNVWVTTVTMPFRVTCLSWRSFGIGFADCGGWC